MFASGIFPEPEHDPVIQIANMVIRQGDPEPCIRNVFTLDTCAPIVGCQVISCDRETVLLEVKFPYTNPLFPLFTFFFLLLMCALLSHILEMG